MDIKPKIGFKLVPTPPPEKKRNDGEFCNRCGMLNKPLPLATSISRWCPRCESTKKPLAQNEQFVLPFPKREENTEPLVDLLSGIDIDDLFKDIP